MDMDGTQELQVVETSAIEAIERAGLDVQIKTAKAFPRELQKCIQKAVGYACFSKETAEECHYALPRAGKTISGPSVRLAEIIASTWENLRVTSRIIEVGQRTVTAMGVAHDLETNVARTSHVLRRITTKAGKRFDDDMIQTTCAAACSIAERNAIFKVVPKANWLLVANAAQKMAYDGKMPLDSRRQRALDWFSARGAPEEAILKYLKVTNRGQVSPEHLQELTEVKTAIIEGRAQIDTVFGLEQPEAPGKAGPPPEPTAPRKPMTKSEPSAPRKPAAVSEPNIQNQPPVTERPSDTPSEVPDREAAPEEGVGLPPDVQGLVSTMFGGSQPGTLPTPTAAPAGNEEQQKAEVWAEWEKVRGNLTPAEMLDVRELSKVFRIGPRCSTENLQKVIQAANDTLAARSG